ncbi:MAG TPA: RNA polymerase sigma factor [Polyangia bacterium]|nr:RNA polymerase sigma factor [Polyangia bacterium]
MAQRATPERDAEDAAELAALMARYCDGDARAFHALYAALAPKILGYLTGLIGDRATAEDLLQQTFMKLHQGRASYVRGANPAPWLYTIAHRACIDEIRRKKRSKVRLSTDGTLPREPAADLGGAAEAAGATSNEADVERGLAALATLPALLREAVLLTKIQGRSSAEAALIAGTTAGAIKVRAHRGYVALRNKLLGATEDEGPAAALGAVALDRVELQ